MCVRYRLSGTEEEVSEFFEAEPTEELPPRYNIAPSQPVPCPSPKLMRLQFQQVTRTALTLLRSAVQPKIETV
jgi:putative SOS response-associated peptidase YedK